MLTILAWVGVVLAIAVMVAAVLACFLGLPGTAVVLVVAFVLSACTGWERPPWWVVLVFLGLVLLAEGAESELSAWGARRFGSAGKTAVWALVGGVGGALIGGSIGPLVGGLLGPVGSVAGAIVGPIVCSLVGGYLGGYWYERRQGSPPEEARRAGWGALVGRAAGGVVKGVVAATMTALTAWLLFRAGGPFA